MLETDTVTAEPGIDAAVPARTVTLGDIRAALQEYLDSEVESEVDPVEPDSPGSLGLPPETGTFTVRVKNADEPTGVRLVNVRHHLTMEPSGEFPDPPNRVWFLAPLTPPARATNDSTAPVLLAGTRHKEMYVFPLDPVLEVGDTDTIVGLQVETRLLGEVKIRSHIHATCLTEDLFAMTTNKNGNTTFQVE
jgi:hypothetical protein